MNDLTNYPFCSSLKEAWKKVHGVKKAIWGATALFILICAGGSSILSWILMTGEHLFMPHFVGITHRNFEILLVNMAFNDSFKFTGVALLYYVAVISFEIFILLPMRFGVLLIPIRRAIDKHVSPLFIFKFFHWHYIMKFIWLECLLMLIVGIPGTLAVLTYCLKSLYPMSMAIQITGIILCVLFSALTLYLAIAYLFAGQIIIDRDVTAWQAMKISRKTVTKRWFGVFFTLIWLGVTLFVSAALLMIGLIWTVPYVFNVVGVLYRDMVGIEGKDPATQFELNCCKKT